MAATFFTVSAGAALAQGDPPRSNAAELAIDALARTALRSVIGTMTLDQALYEMELVGHDFFLFVDEDTLRGHAARS